MTDKEIQDRIDQAHEDVINLDYSKWSARQRQLKLSSDHSLWQQERDRTLARQKADNAESRRKYLERLEADKAAKQAERDAENKVKQQAAEESLKRRLKTSYMSNPAATDEDFERDYPQLKSEFLRSETVKKDVIARESMARSIRESF